MNKTQFKFQESDILYQSYEALTETVFGILFFLKNADMNYSSGIYFFGLKIQIYGRVFFVLLVDR